MQEIDQFRMELGLSPRNFKQRKCMLCCKHFLSSSPDNRRCDECRKVVRQGLVGRGQILWENHMQSVGGK